jgi:hypothetical protein
VLQRGQSFVQRREHPTHFARQIEQVGERLLGDVSHGACCMEMRLEFLERAFRDADEATVVRAMGTAVTFRDVRRNRFSGRPNLGREPEPFLRR